MLNYYGGQTVKGGFYWNLEKWEIVIIENGRGVLPGVEAYRYIKLPTLLFVCCAPLMGLLYVVFLPFIGLAMALGLAGRKIAHLLRKAFAELRTLVHRAQRA